MNHYYAGHLKDSGKLLIVKIKELLIHPGRQTGDMVVNRGPNDSMTAARHGKEIRKMIS